MIISLGFASVDEMPSVQNGGATLHQPNNDEASLSLLEFQKGLKALSRSISDEEVVFEKDLGKPEEEDASCNSTMSLDRSLSLEEEANADAEKPQMNRKHQNGHLPGHNNNQQRLSPLNNMNYEEAAKRRRMELARNQAEMEKRKCLGEKGEGQHTKEMIRDNGVEEEDKKLPAKPTPSMMNCSMKVLMVDGSA